jgi:hypothetical protein
VFQDLVTELLTWLGDPVPRPEPAEPHTRES